jgi:cytidine deaminase
MLVSARVARANAYAPYSQYRVGATVLTRRGTIHAGANVENATLGATLCAERAAIAAMVVAGAKHPVACLILTAGPRPASPCGICRQVLAQFATDMAVVLVGEGPGLGGGAAAVTRRTVRLRALLPDVFRLREVRP